MQDITPQNMEEKLKSFFLELPPLQKNYCEKCLVLMGSQFDTDNLDSTLMDTGVCDECGTICDVVNPLIYTVAKLEDLSIYGKSPRIFREDGLNISHKRQQINKKIFNKQSKNAFADYLDVRYKKIILIFACLIVLIMIGALTSPSENKELVMVVSSTVLLALSGVVMAIYTWADFAKWKKDLKNKWS